MAKIFVFFWCLAGLLTLDVVLRVPARRATPAGVTPANDTIPVITQIQTRCELPAGTVVFVVRRTEVSP
jgi:hypothetical protein